MEAAGVAFESLLLETMLAPMMREFDAVGAYGIGSFARSVAQGDTHGFGALIAQMLEKGTRR